MLFGHCVYAIDTLFHFAFKFFYLLFAFAYFLSPKGRVANTVPFLHQQQRHSEISRKQLYLSVGVGLNCVWVGFHLKMYNKYVCIRFGAAALLKMISVWNGLEGIRRYWKRKRKCSHKWHNNNETKVLFIFLYFCFWFYATMIYILIYTCLKPALRLCGISPYCTENKTGKVNLFPRMTYENIIYSDDESG